ncbi:RNase H domain-containing protein [Trichonephila clavipes]|nr:RNase H domain-containing protein [Trichonephila clavipes]
MALRICSGAFRTSPVQSLYVNCHQLPLDLRRRKLSLAFYFKILSVPSHPLQNVYMSTSMKRLYDARPSNIRPFMDRMKLHISELDLPNVRIQQRNLFLFQPWNTPRFHYINPFATYSKSTVAPVVFQRVFAYHRSQYSRYSAIYTDGSKRADYVGCGVVIEDIMHGYRLDTSCSIFTAEAVAIYRALQLIDSNMPRKYCIYTDSMSVLEALENYNDRCHPVVCTILDITSRLYSKGFDIVFCWLPSHVGIIGNEQADSAAKSATTHLPLAVPLSDMKRVIMHHIFKIWQESWSQQLDNKLHSVKPVIGAWPVMPMRRTDVKLTRLRIGHTRFTHRHLLFGERAPECPSCHVSYTVHHILIDCPVFNHHRITPKLPSNIKAGYLNCKLRPYIPNPLRCFKCQRFGHSQNSCPHSTHIFRCAAVGHSSTDCTLEPKCINCSQPHTADSKLCPKWKTEKQIQEIKANRNITYVEARKLIVPQTSHTYAQAAKSSNKTSSTQTDENITKIKCPPRTTTLSSTTKNKCIQTLILHRHFPKPNSCPPHLISNSNSEFNHLFRRTDAPFTNNMVTPIESSSSIINFHHSPFFNHL